MDQWKKTVFVSVGVLACLASGFTGFVTRAKVDMGSASPNQLSLLASTDGSGSIPESQYFFEVTELLRREYVEPIKVDDKMTSGAVRGMIGRLRDPDSQFMTPEQFQSHQETLKGHYEGIGVEIRNEFNPEELERVQDGEAPTDALLLLPEVYISAVLKGSPADRAGIKVGDRIESIDKKSLVTFRDIVKMRELQAAVNEKKATATELNKFRDELKKKIESNLPPGKVREHLMVGVAGEVALQVTRDGKVMNFAVPKAKSSVVPVEDLSPGVVRLNVFAGVGEALKAKSIVEGTVIDLRGSLAGDPNAVMEVLQELLPNGKYGHVVTENGTATHSFVLTAGQPQVKKVRVLVDETTRGASKILAKILQEVPEIMVDGEVKGDAGWISTIALPDGSGYTMFTGYYVNKTSSATALRGGK